MTNLFAGIILSVVTNYCDLVPAGPRGDVVWRTNYVTTTFAVAIPGHGWITNSVTKTNRPTKLRWVEEQQ